jgi:hypothetical protein
VKVEAGGTLYVQPATCLECAVKHAKNRQQSIIDTHQSHLNEKLEGVLERALKVSDRDRPEVIETGKRLAMLDHVLDRNKEVHELWTEFSEVWNGAERLPAPMFSPNGQKRSPKTLSIQIDNAENTVKVTCTWRKGSEAVRKEDISTL